jgi:hypothetical protein
MKIMNVRMPIELDGLSDKRNIVLFSEGGKIDFTDGCVSVGTYFDDPKQTKDEFFAPLRLFINRQQDTNVIHIPVPSGARQAMIVLTSASDRDDFKKIKVFAA